MLWGEFLELEQDMTSPVTDLQLVHMKSWTRAACVSLLKPDTVYFC